jgi:hypothetical protein
MSTCGCGTEIQTGNQVDESNCNLYCNGSTNADGGASTCGGQSGDSQYWSIFQNQQLQGCYSPPLPGSVAGEAYVRPRDAGGAAASSSASSPSSSVPPGYTVTVVTTTSVYTTTTQISTSYIVITTTSAITYTTTVPTDIPTTVTTSVTVDEYFTSTVSYCLRSSC